MKTVIHLFSASAIYLFGISTSLIFYLRCRILGAKVSFMPDVCGWIRLNCRGDFYLDEKCRFNSGPLRNFVGGDRRIGIFISKGAKLSIGRETRISNSTIVCTTNVSIGDRVYIGGGCDIFDTDFHPISCNDRNNEGLPKKQAVIIEDDVFVGFGVTILKGVRVGRGSVIAARSLVVKDIPANQLWAGVPAQCIRTINADEH